MPVSLLGVNRIGKVVAFMLVKSDWKRVALPFLAAACALGGCARPEKTADSSGSASHNQASADGADVNNESISSMLDDYEKTRGKRQQVLVMPNSVEAAVAMAERSMKDEQFDNAIQYADFVIARRPDLAEGYHLRGKAKFESADAGDAQRDLEHAASLDPRSEDTFEMLANLYMGSGQADRALVAITQAIKLRPQTNRLYELRAAVFGQLGKNKEALGDLDKSVEMQPGRSGPYVKRGKFLEACGKHEEALADFSKALSMDDMKGDFQRAELIKLHAAVLSKLGRHEEAIKDLSTAMETIEADDDALRMRGKEYVLMKDYQKAIADYTAAIEQSPEFARASYEARSDVYTKLGKDDLAAQDLKKAATLKNKPAEKVIFESH